MKDQLLLDLIATTFSSTLASPDLPNQLQELKKHLFNRSFDEAFPTTTSTTSNAVEDGCERSESNLKAYIVRWVPTRALCYARIFERIAKFLPDESLHVVCVGAGCGSETLALQASLKCQYVMDSCPEWEGLLSRITEAANSSSSLTDANVRFQYADVVKQFAKYADVFRTTDLVTLMFTLNELVTAQGKVPATKFLIDLVKTIPKGSLVLVVDSPTYSVVEVAGKKFPVSFLIDRLTGLEKVWQIESEWFRLDKDLKYPIQLENMRYFGMLMRKK